ncbi:hypothetical protein GCM10007973_32860 [Polymorphobacter multimanifer]|uniref:Transmembrane anchor protein n=1 Tax=Polymorphobacter multimanifer TaxID=1070431 RepID=A0A841LER5_9SPHN|nr:transmembrane anchor protein [Polymorphobacter multimanifer]MBB6229543.1 hypothetical protein [Polymorphobacter multimanifer]GGI94106.1 hypothetical protein GCM10007973_32860 [Polymorphobacter multimanifer]
MFNSQLPPISELPSSRQLLGSTLLAGGVAAALLATVILPSEYGVDPTGIGRLFGLTEMGKIKMQLAQEAARDAAVEATLASQPAAPTVAVPGKSEAGTETGAERSDTITVKLAVGEAAEVKATATKGIQIGFDWSVAGGHVNYDTHADAPGIDYHGYGKGRESTGERGSLNAAFDGKHGWFWRNRSDAPVTITLRTTGAYTEIKRVV